MGMTIVKDGEALATIVVDSDAPERAKLAARELQTYLKKMSGVEVPIKTDREKATKIRIHVGSTGFTRGIGFSSEGLGREGFRIKTVNDNLILLGKDDDGTEFAVFHFLEKLCGVRWFWPGDLGEVVPKKDAIEIGETNIEEEPDFKWRRMGFSYTRIPDNPLKKSWNEAMGLENQAKVELWTKRNKLGGLRISGGHAWGQIVPPERYGEAHPEYFALVNGERTYKNFDGKHGCQLCTTNPEVVQLVVEYVRRYLDDHEDVDAVSISPNDSLGFCECEQCRKLDGAETIRRGEIEYPRISNRMFTFANQVGEEVSKTHPDKYVFMLAYLTYREPPTNMRILRNVIVHYCIGVLSHWNLMKKEKDYSILDKWTQICDNMAIYEYYINGSWPDLPRLITRLIDESIKKFYERGVRFYSTQAGDGFAINGLNYYVASKLLWDKSLDLEAILDDFYDKCFGQASKAMRKYFELLENAWKTSSQSLVDPDRILGEFRYSDLLAMLNPEVLRECRASLREARKTAESEKILQRVEFVERGFRYVELTIIAIKKAFELEKLGISVSSRESDSIGREAKSRKAIGLLRETLQAWRQRNEFVEKERGDFTLSYYWIKYNSEYRRFDPTKKIETCVESDIFGF